MAAQPPSAWVVYALDEADVVIGRIRNDGDRFRVGLVDEDLEPYAFATLGESRAWFEEYRWALALGSTEGGPSHDPASAAAGGARHHRRDVPDPRPRRGFLPWFRPSPR